MFPDLSNLKLQTPVGTPSGAPGGNEELSLFSVFESYRAAFDRKSPETKYVSRMYPNLHTYLLNVTQPARPPPPVAPRTPPNTQPSTPPRTPPRSSLTSPSEATTPIVEDPRTPQDRPTSDFESSLMWEIHLLQRDTWTEATAFKTNFLSLYTILVKKLNDYQQHHRLQPPM